MSGEISLACSWRVTPLDVAHIKVKAKQTELDYKEEMLALLLERYSTTPGLVPPRPPATEPGPSEAPGNRRSATDMKRMHGQRGQLNIKVCAFGYTFT